jgi:predicted nucleic acid-binding protein
LEKHGWTEEVQAASLKLVVVKLTINETKRAMTIAEQIAQDPDSDDLVAVNHLGEAQTIVLALRPEYQNDLLLLDELAARSVAKKMGLKISGFPGVLLLATQSGLLSAEELRARLETCRQKGTHYATTFIQQVYEMAKQNPR